MKKFFLSLFVSVFAFVGFCYAGYNFSNHEQLTVQKECKSATKAYQKKAKAEILQDVVMTKQGIKDTTDMLERVSVHYYDFCVVAKNRYGKSITIEEIEALMFGLMRSRAHLASN